MSKRKSPQARDGELGIWHQYWEPPKKLKIADLFHTLTMDENGALHVSGKLVSHKSIKRHWKLIRDLIDDDDKPKVYRFYKKAIDELRARDAG